MTGRAGDIEKRYEAGGKDSKKWTTVVGRETDNGFFFLEIGRKILLLKLIILQYSVVFLESNLYWFIAVLFKILYFRF